MKRKRTGNGHENLPEQVIRRAYEEDEEALAVIIRHYENYVNTIIRNTATRYGMTIDADTVKDIADVVWIKFVLRKMKRFTDFD